MRTTVDAAGRIVIPKDIRDSLGLTGGTEVEISWRDGGILIEPVPVPMQVVRRRGRVVIAADADLPTLTSEEVRRMLDEGRR